jgi:hypothetical protein
VEKIVQVLQGNKREKVLENCGPFHVKMRFCGIVRSGSETQNESSRLQQPDGERRLKKQSLESE